jgi:hypothetical protein
MIIPILVLCVLCVLCVSNHPHTSAHTNPLDLDRAALILQIVCAHFHCSNADLESRGPAAEHFAWPRYIAARLIKNHTSMSLTVIGALFNRSLPEAFDLLEGPATQCREELDEICFIASRVQPLLPTIE